MRSAASLSGLLMIHVSAVCLKPHEEQLRKAAALLNPSILPPLSVSRRPENLQKTLKATPVFVILPSMPLATQ